MQHFELRQNIKIGLQLQNHRSTGFLARSDLSNAVHYTISLAHLKPTGSLTWNRHVTLLLFPLRIRKKQHHQFPVMALQNPDILADAFLSAAFGFGLCDACDEDELRGEDEFLELDAVWTVS